MSFSQLRNQFISPLDEYTSIPFWFWNDDLQEDEIVRQIHDFKDKGVMGLIIYPSFSISKDIHNLSERYFDLVRCAVNEAKNLEMKVILSDKVMYPFGSAHDSVVSDNPDYRSRGLAMVYMPTQKLKKTLEMNTHLEQRNIKHQPDDLNKSKTLMINSQDTCQQKNNDQIDDATQNKRLYQAHIPFYELKKRDRLIAVIKVNEKTTAELIEADESIETKQIDQFVTELNQKNIFENTDMSSASIIYAESSSSDSCKSISSNNGRNFSTIAADAKIIQTIDQFVIGSKDLLAELVDERAVLLLFIETDSCGTINGIHCGEDDDEPQALSSVDLLNASAAKQFIELTYDRYYHALQEEFGQTIIAMFTDEPYVLGRQLKCGLTPWTSGFLNDYLSDGNRITDLPYLWFEDGYISEITRRKYYRSVNKKLAVSYYQPISVWCENHHISLTGHLVRSNNLGVLKHFQIPKQHLAWRWVTPENEQGISVEHSTIGKCSSDSAKYFGRRRNTNVCFGCVPNGRHSAFTADDMKWYLDWLFVRGVNMIYPHVFFYSVSNERLFNDRPSAVGPNISWWPYYRKFSDYIKRMSWVMTDSQNQTKIAILGQEDDLSWKIAKPLFENQIEFNYFEDQLLVETDTVIKNGEICRCGKSYQVILIPENYYASVTICEAIMCFANQGGKIILVQFQHASQKKKTSDDSNTIYGARHENYNNFGARHENYVPDMYEVSSKENAIENIGVFLKMHNAKVATAETSDELICLLDSIVARDLIIKPASDQLRYSHVIKNGSHFYVLVNEGDTSVEGVIHLAVCGSMELWYPWTGEIKYMPSTKYANHCFISLERRESLIIAIDPTCSSEEKVSIDLDCTINEDAETESWADQKTQINTLKLDCMWKITNPKTSKNIMTDSLKSWFELLEVDLDTNNMIYETEFDYVESYEVIKVVLDLGDVRDIAAVEMNGQTVGVTFWRPHRIDISQHIKPGKNYLKIIVTNSKDCFYESTKYPSGLLEPVTLREETIS